MARTLRSVVLAATLTVLLVLPAAAAPIVHGTVVSEDPVDWTPHVLDGTVWAVVEVGGKVIVGGRFTTVRSASSSVKHNRRNLFAFDRKTGAIDPSFRPQPDKAVRALVVTGPGEVVVGGQFTEIAGGATRGLVKLSTATGARLGTFTAATNGPVFDVERAGNRLVVGGRFSKIRGVSRSALAAVDAISGAVDGAFNLPVTEPRKGGRNVLSLDVTPNASRLVIVGNFKKVAGQTRHQVALIDLTTNRLAPWATLRYEPNCGPKFYTYMRDVEFSPDGAYFVIVTTGGAKRGSTCDTAARWETLATGSSLRETWINYTGGDTLTAVSVTDAAVYVGGHQRWLDNPYGSDSAGPGAVSRPGIGAIHPVSGKALAWNPTRTRGVGVRALVPTPRGLWVGSDTTKLGKEYHARLGFFPLR